MKRLGVFFLLLFVMCIGGVPSVFAADERIALYDVDIAIQKDGTFRVSETIRYDFDDLVRHGIFRTIPFVKTSQEQKRFAMDIFDIQVTDEKAQAYPFTTSTDSSEIELKIGDPDKTISGMHSYAIGYTVAGGLTYFSDHDELYWNAVGNDWEVPIEKAHITVRLPEQMPIENLRVSCFTGAAGSTASECVARTVNTTTLEVSTTEPLAPYEGLTLVAGFPAGIVAVSEPRLLDAHTYTWWWSVLVVLFSFFLWLLAITWYILTPLYIMYRWHRYGRDPKPPMGEVRAWYAAPTGKGGRKLTPGETGALIDEHVGMHEIVATIVDLARRGYFSIEERKANDFYLHKKTGSLQELVPHERTLFDALFSKKDEVRLKTADLIKPVETAKTQLYEAMVHENLFPHNPYWLRFKYYALAVVALVTQNYPLTVIAFFFGRAMPRKTEEGAQAAAIARSTRNFITSQKKQFAFQAKHKMLFEKLLPVAVAFGVEEIWAKRFSKIAVPPPDWYSGSSAHHFKTSVFVHTLNRSFTSSVAKAATPTSSSSGFSSGFSGGSSGGGGGGGGEDT
mgnify:CR=1 FL=1